MRVKRNHVECFLYISSAVSVDRTRDLQIFSLALSQLSYPRMPENDHCAIMADEFPFALSRIVAAHVCESFGFQGVQRSAVDTLADVLVKFLTTAGEYAHQYAENAGRTEAHAGDVMAALQDISPTSPADLTRFVRFVEDSASPALE